MPEKTTSESDSHPEARKYDGYTVENVGIETIPGFYLCGSLYRPAKGKGPFPAVLSPHGHFNSPDLNETGGTARPAIQMCNAGKNGSSGVQL